MDTERDLLAVEAIKNGDPQRYSELVERHEHRVYAVAWSQLGDADLAQEAAQEAFIRGYQHLGFLNQGGKFAAWITVIARNMAVNLGLRRRNELKKRKRWALEQVDRESTPLAEETSEESISTETLRETLAELPAKHRECLVLFYLEGKSIAEAAQAISLSETAFKTRLFRARAALRTHLEKRLDRSLAQLRPRHAVAPIVMGLLTTGKVKAAGILGTSAGGVTKVALSATKLLPFKLLMLGPWITGFVPAMLLHYYTGRWELKNFRHQQGFRAQTYRHLLMKSLFMTPLLVGMILICTGIVFVFLGKGWVFRILGILCL